MAWTHCDEKILDDEPCPGCGLSKSEWTLEVDVTRIFEVTRSKTARKSRDAWIEVQLLGGDGAPLANAAYKIALPSSRVKKGELDDQGVARIEKIREGTCRISFPGNLEEPVERETGERHVFELEPSERLEFRFSR